MEGHIYFVVNVAPILALFPFDIGLVVRVAYNKIKFTISVILKLAYYQGASVFSAHLDRQDSQGRFQEPSSGLDTCEGDQLSDIMALTRVVFSI